MMQEKLLLEKLNLYNKDINFIIDTLQTRVNKIYSVIFSTAIKYNFIKENENINKFYIDYCQENEICECGRYGDELSTYTLIIKAINNDYIKIFNYSHLSTLIIIHNQLEINLCNIFPKQWLYDEKLAEQEIENGFKEYYNFLKKKKDKNRKKKNKKEKMLLQNSIKSKLSKEELQLISFKK